MGRGSKVGRVLSDATKLESVSGRAVQVQNWRTFVYRIVSQFARFFYFELIPTFLRPCLLLTVLFLCVCFCLQLPQYADRQTLREKLLYAISANAGFELT